MKKLLFIFLLIALPKNTFSQDSTFGKHEIRMNAAYLLGGIPEIGYAYVLNEESTLGIDLLISTKDDLEPYFALTPNYRFYFGNKPAAGFFAEIFSMLNVTEGTAFEVYDSIFAPGNYVITENNRETDVALGISIGGKFLTKKNFLFELYGGVGRNLFNEKSVDFIPRLGVSIGKRF